MKKYDKSKKVGFSVLLPWHLGLIFQGSTKENQLDQRWQDQEKDLNINVTLICHICEHDYIYYIICAGNI